MSPDKPTGLPKVVKLQDWPALDRGLWETGTTWDASYFKKPYAAQKRPVTIRNAARAHGRLLGVLRDIGRLDETLTPAQRMTRDTADLFLRSLMEAGNNNNTIKVRFFDLQAALRVMHPGMDFSWLNRPGALSLHVMLPTAPTPRRIIGAQKLYRWGFDLMQAAAADVRPIKRAVMLRNGLMIAVLACRAPRQRALAAMRLGQQVEWEADDAWIRFASGDVKNRRRLAYGLPEGLKPWVEKYLSEIRPILLGKACHDAFWVGQNGKALAQAGISGALRRAGESAYGKAIGTHQFRHELASALAEQDPDNPGLAAAILGISPDVAEDSYTHARNEVAARRVADHLAVEREQTRLLADRLYGNHARGE